MLDILAYISYPLLAVLGFGFVIAIHEFGHFVFAKWAGVRVDTFSIGFGPVLFKKTIGETDYVISLLPLGGFVKMLGQEDVPSGEEAQEIDPRSYLAKSAGWKALILLGGVLFNLISSYLILLGLVIWGMPVFRPQVGEVIPQVIDHTGLPVQSPAAKLGLERGDRFVIVDGEKVRSFDDVITAVIFAGNQPMQVEVERAGQRITLPTAGAPPVVPVFDGRFGKPSLGIEFPYSNRVVATLDAPTDGVKRLDRIVTIAGEDVSGLIGQQIQDRLMRHFGETVPVTVERGGQRVELMLTYAGERGAFDTRAGIPVRIGALEPDGKPAKAGLKTGDWVVGVGGKEVCGTTHFMALARQALDRDGAALIAIQRGAERSEVRVEGSNMFGVRKLGIPIETVWFGRLPRLLPALGGGPSALAEAGVQANDTLVARKVGDDDVRIAWVSGGEAMELSLGLDATAWRAANRYQEPGLLRKIFGARAIPSLATRLAGSRVSAVTTDDVMVTPASEQTEVTPVAIKRSELGPAAEKLVVGDWISDARLGPAGAVIEITRGAGNARWATLRPKSIGTAILFDKEELPYALAPDGPVGDGLNLINDAAYNLVVKSVTLLPRLFRSPEEGGVDPNKTLTGPIGIFREMKSRAELMGFDSFLKLVALVGLNLFVVNLLPIPITDGGQLLMLGVETVIRRPLPMWLRNGLMWAGVIMVGLLFVYICGLDLLRLFGIA
ncbi:MAG: site-2 protease family protein [Planctomycetota bacterium]